MDAPKAPSSHRPSKATENNNNNNNNNNKPLGGKTRKKGDNSTSQLTKALERVRKSSGLPPPPPKIDEDSKEEKANNDESSAKLPESVLAKVASPVANTSKGAVENLAVAAEKASPPPLVPLPIVQQKNGIRVGYAVSLVKCGDFQSSSAGLIDASLVMRHSIHLTHLQSKYDYIMYAIVHKQAEACSQILKDVGFEIVLVDQPVNATDIRGEHLRTNIHKEWCCGEQEFVKLFAYTLPDPVIVHVDIDFAFMRPIDDLFDAIMYDKDSPEGKAARSRIPLERPKEGFPDKIEAFLTRDWPQVSPGRKPLYQAGFLVARRNPQILKEVVDVVLEGNYTPGFSRENGWGGAGYGGLVGAMAMQGLMAYYYDMVRPNTAVELNQCRFNHMGMDVLYRHAPNFRKKHSKAGECRNDLDYCEDCTVTDFELIHNVHYTQCKLKYNDHIECFFVLLLLWLVIHCLLFVVFQVVNRGIVLGSVTKVALPRKQESSAREPMLSTRMLVTLVRTAISLFLYVWWVVH
jgi:hypothetical protein